MWPTEIDLSYPRMRPLLSFPVVVLIPRHSFAREYALFGLNGFRAQTRRIRQIEAGSLRVANGLVL